MRYRAVFFDVGGTLVDNRPSFPELFAEIVTGSGHPVTPDAVREASVAVTDGFSRAAQENRLWTTSPERSRAFWTSVYDLMLEALDLPVGDGLRDTLYEAFTDRANYRLYDDLWRMDLGSGRLHRLTQSPRACSRGGPDPGRARRRGPEVVGVEDVSVR